MSSARYLEIDSTYRNRNQWPLPGQFEIPISQTGRKGRYDAVDPVSVASPLQLWTSNNFNPGTSSRTITLTVATPNAANPISGTNSRALFIATSFLPLQTISNYYLQAMIKDTTINEASRIIDYKYLGVDSGGNYKAQFIVDNSFSSTFASGDTLVISDPTDLSDTSNPEFFVPYGRLGNDGYSNLILYNETLNQYRPTSKYDANTHLLRVNTTTSVLATSSSGPVTGWSVTDNYCIRQNPPILFGTILAGSTSSNINLSATASTVNDFYNRQFLRITSGTDDNLIRMIVAYNGTTQTATVYPGFTTAPVAGDTFEILGFSYDNLNPFVYTGSTVSQQEDVCYEIELLDLLLPNKTLSVGQGSRIAFYPFVYVELTTISSSSSGNRDILYSNNPNSTKMLFRCTVNDTSDPFVATQIKVDGDGATQTIKFKPNCNLMFSVRLPNGDIYNTIVPEQYSPLPPLDEIQISAMFGLKRLTN
jgi:hypothetical protein